MFMYIIQHVSILVKLQHLPLLSFSWQFLLSEKEKLVLIEKLKMQTNYNTILIRFIYIWLCCWIRICIPFQWYFPLPEKKKIKQKYIIDNIHHKQ